MKLPFALLLAALIPLSAQAAVTDAWKTRRVVSLDTSDTGVKTAAAVADAAIPVRLHSGNFDFLLNAPEGADLRVLAADDKTPLKFHVERFDAVNELALIWVRVPLVAPNLAGQKIHLYSGNPDAPAENMPAAASYDAATLAAFHFREGDERPVDSTEGALRSSTPVAIEKAGLLGTSARFDGSPMVLPESPRLGFAAGGALTFSAWVRPADALAGAVLYRQGPLSIALDGGKVSVAGLAPGAVSGGTIAAANWQHVAVAVGGGKATIYVNGASVAEGAGQLPEMRGEARIGEGLVGLLDEVQLASVTRNADWIAVAASAQGAESKLVSVSSGEEKAADESHSYFGILFANLTVDAWVVIAILAVMFLVALEVMVSKTRMVSRIDKDNRRFLQRFRKATHDFLELETGSGHPHSSLFRLYQAGAHELRKRADAKGEYNLSGASIDAIKAAIDADMVRETHKLNGKMVFLTIAISGGPFLGLLGTVVGVMITFAAIAAAGDVNVNAIAPGIAAALLATVAGLAVAIPALFGYNYLASRIKNISADMQIFVDEFITRIAESYSR